MTGNRRRIGLGLVDVGRIGWLQSFLVLVTRRVTAEVL